jgi:hypothetical protein
MESASLEQDVDEIRRILPDLETAYSEAMAELASIEKGMRE